MRVVHDGDGSLARGRANDVFDGLEMGTIGLAVQDEMPMGSPVFGTPLD